MDRDRQGSVGMGQDQGRGAVGAKWAVRHGWASDTHTMSKDPADAFVAWLVGGCRWMEGWDGWRETRSAWGTFDSAAVIDGAIAPAGEAASHHRPRRYSLEPRTARADEHARWLLTRWSSSLSCPSATRSRALVSRVIASLKGQGHASAAAPSPIPR